MFLSKKVLLQHKDGPPSDCVFSGNFDEHGMWPARQGRTVCNFSIPFGEADAVFVDNSTEEIESHIPFNGKTNDVITEVSTSPLPSSYWNKQAGGIRYLIAVVVESKTGKEPAQPLAAYRDLHVRESVRFRMNNLFVNTIPHTSPLTIETSEHVSQGVFGFGKKGIVKLSASIRVPQTIGLETGVWLSGNVGFIGVDIKNATTKHVLDS